MFTTATLDLALLSQIAIIYTILPFQISVSILFHAALAVVLFHILLLSHLAGGGADVEQEEDVECLFTKN